jgi:nucleoid DNA-binding protein
MLNKKDVIDAMASKIEGSTKVAAEQYLMALLEVFTDCVESGEGMKLVGYFNTEVKETKARNGRNPQTKKAILIPAGKTVKMKVSPVIKALVK